MRTQPKPVTDFKTFVELLDNKKMDVILYQKGNELFKFVRGNSKQPHLLKQFYNGVSEWYFESKVISDISKEVA
jgi:hypothetical protein